MAQFFGTLPIVSIFSHDRNAIKFKFFALRTLHAILWLISAFTFLFLEISRIINEEDLNAKSVSGIIFYTSGITTAVLFFRIVFKWNQLLKVFKETEDIFNLNPYTLSGWSLKKRMNVASFVLLFFALCEHLFSWYSYLFDRYTQATVCNWEIGSWFYYFMSLHQSQVYRKFAVNWYTVLWVSLHKL